MRIMNLEFGIRDLGFGKKLNSRILKNRYNCHCERPKGARQSRFYLKIRDCFVASLLVMTLLLPASLCATTGTYGTDSIFEIGSGSRALSMGGAFTALADDSSAVFWNPAGLINMERQEMSLLHYPLYAGSLYDSATYGQPILDFGALGLGLYRVYTGGIDTYDANDFATGTSQYQEYKATASYAAKLNAGFTMGFNLNLFDMSLINVNAVGFGGDLGVLYEPVSFLRFGAVIHNIMNPTLSMKTAQEELPRTYTGGALIKLYSDKVKFNLTFDAFSIDGGAIKYRAGFETALFGILSARAGYDDSRINFGGGIRFANISFDYAYGIDTYLGPLSRFTLSYDFGLSLDEQKVERQNALKEQVKKMIAEEFKKKEDARAKEHFDRAFALYKQEKYEESLDALAKAFEWNEDYKDAKMLKGLITKKLVGKYYDEAVASYNEKNYISALENFKNVASIDPEFKDTAVYMGRLDEKMKMKSDAKTFFSKGVEYYVNKRYDDAIEMFGKAINVEPGNTMIKAYLNKARAQASVVSGGKKLSPEQSDKVKKLYYSGLKSYTAGDLNAAVDSWKAALEINPEDIKILKSIEKAQAEQAELAKRGIK